MTSLRARATQYFYNQIQIELKKDAVKRSNKIDENLFPFSTPENQTTWHQNAPLQKSIFLKPLVQSF